MIKLMRNQKGFSAILVILGFILAVGIAGGVYYSGIIKNSKPESIQPSIDYQNNPQPTQTTKQTSTTSAQQDETANWKVYNISECLATFKYPVEWQTNLSDKGNCTIHYTKPPINGQPMDTFIIFDVQPGVFMGQQNIKIDENKVVNKTTINGVEETITYSEEKDINIPIYLSNKNYFFKKGPIYFSIISQYEKGDKNFENTVDEIAGTVSINGDETFYNNYVKKLEGELGNFTPKNK